MKLPKLLNREKYMIGASLIYLLIAIGNSLYKVMPSEVAGVLFILMLALPFLNARVGKIVFKK